MARSIDLQPKAARGFIPARTDEERYLMRHIEDLARAALGRAGVQEGFRFEGGWLNAERRVLCIEPEYRAISREKAVRARSSICRMR